MIVPSECRKNAEECLRLAHEANDERRKTLLLNLARSWGALAGQYERLEAASEVDRKQATPTLSHDQWPTAAVRRAPAIR
jgi:hypothetical protein